MKELKITIRKATEEEIMEIPAKHWHKDIYIISDGEVEVILTNNNSIGKIVESFKKSRNSL